MNKFLTIAVGAFLFLNTTGSVFATNNVCVNMGYTDCRTTSNAFVNTVTNFFSFDYSGTSDWGPVIAMRDTDVFQYWYATGVDCSSNHCQGTIDGLSFYPSESGPQVAFISNGMSGQDYYWVDLAVLENPTITPTPTPTTMPSGATYQMNDEVQNGVSGLFADLIAGAFTIIVVAVGLVAGYWITKKLVAVLLNWFRKFT